MSMEIAGILGSARQTNPGQTESKPPRMPTLTEQAGERRRQELERQEPDVDLERLVQEIELAASTLNKRLRYSINRDLGQVVVKVVDRSTDKVIKELPPEALQRLHVRIREAIGLLIDEEI